MRDLEVAIPLAEQGRVRLERAARRQLAQRDVLDAGREVRLGRRRGAVGGGFEADPAFVRKLLRDDYEQAVLGSRSSPGSLAT